MRISRRSRVRSNGARRANRTIRTGAFASLAVVGVVALAIAALGTDLVGGAASPPSRPRQLTVTSGPAVGQVALAWAAPSTLGGSPITDYGVEMSTDGGTTWTSTFWLGSTALTASSTSQPAIACANSGAANVNGLGCTYRMYARTALGDSPPSTDVTAWIVPSAPRSFTATPTDDTFNTINLSWLRPTDTGGFATLQYAVAASMDGGPFTVVRTQSTLTASVACTGLQTCDYRVTPSNGQGEGEPSVVRKVQTAPSGVRHLDSRALSQDLPSGTSTVGVTWDEPASGMPVDHYELSRCFIAAGAETGCGTNANPNVGDWSASEVVPPPVLASMNLSETCTAGVASCYWRVRAVNARGGAGVWHSTNVQPWAPIVGLSPAPGPDQVEINFTGPAESGPDGSPKYYTAWICKADCTNASNWADSGLTITYPPSGSAPHSAGTFTCEAGLICHVRLQLTDGRGDHGILSAAAIYFGSPDQRRLTVTVIGPGSVTSNLGGIACPGVCTASYPVGTVVGLIATPGPTAEFLGWSGDCVGLAGCVVTMDVDRAVTATFTTYPLGGTPPPAISPG